MVNHDVVRFDVTMHDTHTVTVVQSLTDRRELVCMGHKNNRTNVYAHKHVEKERSEARTTEHEKVRPRWEQVAE